MPQEIRQGRPNELDSAPMVKNANLIDQWQTGRLQLLNRSRCHGLSYRGADHFLNESQEFHDAFRWLLARHHVPHSAGFDTRLPACWRSAINLVFALSSSR